MATKLKSDSYIDTGKEMPPIYRTPCKTIAVDKSLAEQLLSKINLQPTEKLKAREIAVTGRDRHRHRAAGSMMVRQ